MNDNSFLINVFYEFIYEALKFKEMILFNKTLLNAREIQDVLTKMIFYKKELALQEGSLIEAAYLELSYIMTVLADELFINLDWEHHDEWKSYNMETKIFNTHIGGVKLFNNIDRFLISNSSYRICIGSAYLLCLGLGFRGQYRGVDDHGKIAEYKVKLFEMIYHKRPSLEYGNFDLFPEVLNHTITRVESKRLSSYKIWGIILGFVSITYVCMSYFIWHEGVKPITHIVHMIEREIQNATK
ncbi:MAG: DotU family type IV/VI secretion system protein [Alphaproteobacteria bacterium]|nr:MAG: DotU family type IV/VI secretion system protein [Alphaproteobacteria bacterium]